MRTTVEYNDAIDIIADVVIDHTSINDVEAAVKSVEKYMILLPFVSVLFDVEQADVEIAVSNRIKRR